MELVYPEYSVCGPRFADVNETRNSPLFQWQVRWGRTLTAYILSFIIRKSSEKHSSNISCTVVMESIHAGFYLSVQIQESMSLCAHDGGAMLAYGVD